MSAKDDRYNRSLKGRARRAGAEASRVRVKVGDRWVSRKVAPSWMAW